MDRYEKWKKELLRIVLIIGILIFAFESVCSVRQMLQFDFANSYSGNVIRDFMKSLLELALILYVFFKPRLRLQLGLFFLIEAVLHEVVLSSGFVTVIFTTILSIPYAIAVIGCLRKKKVMIMIGTIWGIIDQYLAYQNHRIDYFATTIDRFSTFGVIGYRMILFVILGVCLLGVKDKESE